MVSRISANFAPCIIRADDMMSRNISAAGSRVTEEARRGWREETERTWGSSLSGGKTRGRVAPEGRDGRRKGGREDVLIAGGKFNRHGTAKLPRQGNLAATKCET